MSSDEVYVDCESRSKAIAMKFLDACAPERHAVAADYPFPEFADVPEVIYTTEEEIIDRLVAEQHCSYSLYWDCGGSSEQVMLFFTKDGHMIAGLGGPKASHEEALTDLCNLVGGRFGYVTEETCPPETFRDFEYLSRNSSLPCIVEGQLLNEPDF